MYRERTTQGNGSPFLFKNNSSLSYKSSQLTMLNQPSVFKHASPFFIVRCDVSIMCLKLFWTLLGHTSPHSGSMRYFLRWVNVRHQLGYSSPYRIHSHVAKFSSGGF
jgi:hypothetical protein